MDQMTIQKLYELCAKQIQKGNGNKYIAISDDNEGNGYHGLFYGFSDSKELIDEVYDSCETNPNKLIILG